MNKKILKIFLLIIALLFSYNNAFWSSCSSSCSIKDSTAEILSNYFDNNKKILGNISPLLKKWKKQPWYNIQKKIDRIYNFFTNWYDDSYTAWEYFLSQIQFEIPQPIQRDLRLLKAEWENLNAYLKKILEWNYEDTITWDICDWVKYCNFWKGEKELSTVIWKLVWNNAEIIQLYQNSIAWKISVANYIDNKLILVPDNFKSEMNNFYNQYSIYECSKCEWAFADRITKSWDKFILNTKHWNDWIAKWKEAWNMLLNSHSNTAEIQQKERELLSQELSRQWISGSNSAAMLQNLDDYNNNWYTISNNPIWNTFKTFINSVDSAWARKVLSDFWQTINKIYKWVTDTSSVSIREFSNIKEDFETTDEVMNDIDLLYQKQIPFISAHNLNAKKLRAKIIKMHTELVFWINVLDKSIPEAIKVCNDQWKGQGKCGEF